MPLHPHTRESFEKLDRVGRETAVLRAFDSVGLATDRQVATHLGFKDMNAVRPTITHLVKDGTIVETANTHCSVTGRRVRVCRRRRSSDPAVSTGDRRVTLGPRAAEILAAQVRKRGASVRNILLAALRLLEKQP